MIIQQMNKVKDESLQFASDTVMRRARITLACISICGAATLCAAAQPTSPQFRIHDLGPLSGGDTTAGYGISRTGSVAGESRTGPPDHWFHATLWRSGQPIDLGTLNGPESIALGVNRFDQVVGDADLIIQNSIFHHAFIWQNGQMQDLGTLGGPTFNSVATAVNDSGIVVGFSDRPDRATHATMWINGQITDLGTLSGDTFSGCSAINSHGDIVGVSTTGPFSSRVFVYHNGSMQLVPEFGTMAQVEGINDVGQIIGTIFDYSDLAYHAEVWKNGQITDLGRLPNGTNSYTYGINNAGLIVGVGQFSTEDRGLVNHGFIWRNGHMYDLNNLIAPGSGWEINDALAISQNNLITGFGVINGVTHAYELVPINH